MGEKSKISDNKLLYELSHDLRIKRKELSSKLKKSPQLISYSIDKLQKNKVFSEKTIIDPARFGLINIRVIMILTTFDHTIKNEIIKYLKEHNNVVQLEKINLGADLMVEYSVPNLSFFNKLHSFFLQKYSKYVEIPEIYPVLVKHIFPKRYLYKRAKIGQDFILSGDRKPLALNENQRKVIKHLITEPSSSFVNIARCTDIDVRTAIKIVKDMKNKKLIKSFSINLNYELMNISVCYLILRYSLLTPNESKKIISFAKSFPEITELTKIMGRESLMIRLESLDDYKPFIKKIQQEFKFYKYFVYDCNNIIKDNYIPHNII